MKKMNNKGMISVNLVKDKDFILNSINESKKMGGSTSIEKAYIEGLDYVNKLGKHAI